MADGVDPRVALDVALPPTMPSLPPDPSRAPYPLPQQIGADASLRSLLRRDFEGVVHSVMPCAHAHRRVSSCGAGSACRMRGRLGGRLGGGGLGGGGLLRGGGHLAGGGLDGRLLGGGHLGDDGLLGGGLLSGGLLLHDDVVLDAARLREGET